MNDWPGIKQPSVPHFAHLCFILTFRKERPCPRSVPSWTRHHLSLNSAQVWYRLSCPIQIWLGPEDASHWHRWHCWQECVHLPNLLRPCDHIQAKCSFRVDSSKFLPRMCFLPRNWGLQDKHREQRISPWRHRMYLVRNRVLSMQDDFRLLGGIRFQKAHSHCCKSHNGCWSYAETGLRTLHKLIHPLFRKRARRWWWPCIRFQKAHSQCCKPYNGCCSCGQPRLCTFDKLIHCLCCKRGTCLAAYSNADGTCHQILSSRCDKASHPHLVQVDSASNASWWQWLPQRSTTPPRQLW